MVEEPLGGGKRSSQKETLQAKKQRPSLQPETTGFMGNVAFICRIVSTNDTTGVKQILPVISLFDL